MKYKIPFIFYILLRFGVIAKDTRIIGGSHADAREFPYTVSVRDISENKIYCSGVIISHRHILTSAQCTPLHEQLHESIRIYTVITPSTSLNGPSFKIDKIFLHPDFTGIVNPTSMNLNDISVIKVVETIEFNEFQNKIDLPTQNIQENVECILAGWGSLTYPQYTTPSYLQKVKMPNINSVTCSEYVPFLLHPGQFCKFQRVGMGVAIGDSGAPLVCNNKFVGISSLNVPGAQGYPEIFVNVHYYLNFIQVSMRY